MNIKYDNRTITCDLQLALQLFCKNVELYQNFDKRLDFLKQLFDIKKVYDCNSTKQYILKTHVDGLLNSLNDEDLKNLKNLLIYHFYGSWGGDIKISNNKVEIMSYND